MIKTIITPQNNNYNLVIPNNYIGKKIEVIFYSLDEVDEDISALPKKTMADFWGILSDETASNLHKEVEESRKNWEERYNKQL